MVLNDTSKDGFAPDEVNVQKMKAHKSKVMKLGGVHSWETRAVLTQIGCVSAHCASAMFASNSSHVK
jgi:hypothetical protein